MDQLDQVCRCTWHVHNLWRVPHLSFTFYKSQDSQPTSTNLNRLIWIHLTHPGEIRIHPEAVWARCSPRACSSSGPNCEEASECRKNLQTQQIQQYSKQSVSTKSQHVSDMLVATQRRLICDRLTSKNLKACFTAFQYYSDLFSKYM